MPSSSRAPSNTRDNTTRVDILTLFPGAFAGPFDVSMLRRAREGGLLDVHLHDIRDFATDRHRTVDDYPFGGGQGMVMRVDVIDSALQHVRDSSPTAPHVVALTPQGQPLTDRLVRQLAHYERLVLLCGRYEGFDERVAEHLVDQEVSIGDFVLTGGELPAMVLVDAVARHIPGVLGDEASPEDESFADGLLEYPHYTRPADYRGWTVPNVLLQGNHADIEAWRRQQRIERTRERRPERLPDVESDESRREKVGIAGVRVRTLRYPDDLPAVLELWRQSGDGRLAEPAELGAMANRNPGLLLVAEEAKHIVGTALAGFDGRLGHVHYLGVQESARRRGIGAALLRVLEERLRALGCGRASVVISGREDEAATFLAEHGWVATHGQVWAREL